jgi:DNA polymerase III subunit beta
METNEVRPTQNPGGQGGTRMKFTAAHADLAACAQTVQRAVASRTTLPVLSGILTTAGDDRVTLVATDHEISIRCSAPATVPVPGSLVFPARYLGDILRKIPYGDVACEVDETSVRAMLTWQRSQFVIHGFAAREFPQLPEIEGARMFTIGQHALRDLIRKTNFAVSREDIRPVLTGAQVEITATSASVFATDGYRIAHASIEGELGGTGDTTVILPGRALSELGRLLNDSEDPVTVAVGANQVRLDFAGIEFTTRVIAGTFPNCRAVVPKEYRATITAETADFLNACDRASLVAREGAQMIMLRLEEGRVRVNSQTPEIGSVQEEVMANTSGEGLEVAFSARYLIEALRTIDTEQFILEVSGPASPARLRPVGRDDAFHIILPIRLD